jgi:dihydrodipicolinate synthase/N-acetylneuraminate lyase
LYFLKIDALIKYRGLYMPASARPPRGLVVELITPLSADGRLDGEGFTGLVQRLSGSADAILVAGPGAGEGLELSGPLRQELFAVALRATADRVPVFLGITGASWEETLESAQAAQELCHRLAPAAPVFLADLPLWYHSNRGLPQACQDLLAGLDLPLVVMNLPGLIARRGPVFKRRNIRTQVFKKLLPTPGLAGLIYQGEMRRFLNYHHAAATRPGFAFYDADEASFLTRPGAWGVVSPGAQLVPSSWQQVTRLCLGVEEADPDQERRFQLWELSRRLVDMAKIYAPNQAALLKAVLASQGVIASPATAPGTPPADAAQLRAMLRAVNSWGMEP